MTSRHVLRTPGLRLRPLAPPDAEPLHRLWTDPAVRRYLWDDEVIPSEQTAAVIETSQRMFAEEGFGLWAATPRPDGDLHGFGGFWYFREPPELELLFGVATAHWGRGYATEIAAALVRHAFEDLGFSEVRASTDLPNLASVRVLEKVGFSFEKQATVGGLDTLFYVISNRES